MRARQSTVVLRSKATEAGMAIAYKYSRSESNPIKSMTSLPQHPLSHLQDPFGIAHIHAALLESARVTAVSLFWLAALPAAAVLSIATIICERLLSLQSTALRLPFLRNKFGIQPLLLRRKGFESRVLGASDRPKTARD